MITMVPELCHVPMPSRSEHHSIQITQWTGLLVEDLYSALRHDRDDETVRGFANELINDKQLPPSYLVRKVSEEVSSAAGERLDLLLRGRYVVERERAERAKSEPGLVKRLWSRFGGEK